jgi:GAF domain-containing protein
MTDPRSPDASDAARRAALDGLVAVARRLDAVVHLAPPDDDALLSAVAQTVATVLDAQAASIALHEPELGQLVFHAAAGPSAGSVVGLRIDAASGIAGYVFSTGQPLAVANVGADPRFDRTVAEATGYVPESIMATPLFDDAGTLGVLEVLDRRSGSFTLRDLDVAAALAREATIVVRAGRRDRDARSLLRAALTAIAGGGDGAGGLELDEAQIDELVVAAAAALPGDPDDPTWRLADRIARLRDVDPDAVELAIEWLDALLRHRRSGRPGSGSGARR